MIRLTGPRMEKQWCSSWKQNFSQIYSIAELFSFLRWKSLLKLDARFKFSKFSIPSLIDPNHRDRIRTPSRVSLLPPLLFSFITFQGMIYLHDSVIKYHGSLSTSNCLVDSRWVVKLADFGLHEFKKNAECEPCDVMKKYRGKKYTDFIYVKR